MRRVAGVAGGSGTQLHRTRRISVVPDGEGMYVVRGRLTPEVAVVLMRAVDAASDALYAGSSEEEHQETDPAQRRADAVGLLAERALSAGSAPGARAAMGRWTERVPRTTSPPEG